MNVRPVVGRCKAALNVGLWVFLDSGVLDLVVLEYFAQPLVFQSRLQEP
jgi:hypothetical protein